MTQSHTYTITVNPADWLYINAYEPHDHGRRGRETFGVVLRDVALLPEEVGHEANVSKRGAVYMTTFQRPTVEHVEGWEKLESELRRMEATNRDPDRLFDDAILEIDFHLYLKQPGPNSRYDSPLVLLPVTRIKIAGYAEVQP